MKHNLDPGSAALGSGVWFTLRRGASPNKNDNTL
jgi:hypothetical protein